MILYLCDRALVALASLLSQIDPKKAAGQRLASFDGDADRIVYHYFDAEVG